MHEHKLGPWLVAGTALLTYFLLIAHHWYFNEWWPVEQGYKYVAKFGSYVATILFCWNFILASRWTFLQKWFGGLDKIYKAHMWVGIVSLVIIFVHPIGLSFRRWPDLMEMLKFWSFRDMVSNFATGFNLGLAALILLVILIGISGWQKLPYQLWKWSHRLFHVFLWLCIIHVILVDAEIMKYPLLQVWFFGWFGWAILASLYSALYYVMAPHYKYVVDRIEYFDDSVEVLLKPSGKRLRFLPSQFTYISFLNPEISKELHPFSIGSAPNPDGTIKFGIKFLGNYTKSLQVLKKGDHALLYGAFGNFSEKFLYGGKDCVFIGGGIGITPFLAMWQAALSSDEQVDIRTNPGSFTFGSDKHKNWKSPHVYLCYLVKNKAEATFLNDIENIAICSQYKGFRNFGLRGHQFDVHYSQEQGRLCIGDLAEKVSYFTKRNFFLCGPKPMVDGMIRDLLLLGVKRRQIIVEDFNYRDMSAVVGLFGKMKTQVVETCFPNSQTEVIAKKQKVREV